MFYKRTCAEQPTRTTSTTFTFDSDLYTCAHLHLRICMLLVMRLQAAPTVCARPAVLQPAAGLTQCTEAARRHSTSRHCLSRAVCLALFGLGLRLRLAALPPCLHDLQALLAACLQWCAAVRRSVSVCSSAAFAVLALALQHERRC